MNSRELAKQIPDKQSSVVKRTATNKNLEKQPYYWPGRHRSSVSTRFPAPTALQQEYLKRQLLEGVEVPVIHTGSDHEF